MYGAGPLLSGTATVRCHHLTPSVPDATRGGLSAAQRRIAYDTLGKYAELREALLAEGEPRSLEARARVLAYSRNVLAILAADSAGR